MYKRPCRTALSIVWLSFMALLFFFTAVQADECPSPERHKISTRVPLMRNMINPNPMAFDFEMPYPCGGTLVFRLVYVPSEGYFDDLSLQMGCDNCGRQTQGYMEAKRTETLGGSFALKDLPEPWQNTVSEMARQGAGFAQDLDSRSHPAMFYFISKYEITKFHWDAVMTDECPGWDRLFDKDDPRPKTDVSWFDAVTFTRRLTEWLLANHPDALPALPNGRFGFIRLPTEIEWEYAARGGHQVPADQMAQEAYFPLKNRDIGEYAVFTQANAAKLPESVAWIGTKCANPLGLFDTAGNASEMMLEPFRFSLPSGLGGAAGGFLIKGGSYRKGSREIMPGRREEMPYFLDGRAFQSNDVGFRVVLAGITTSSDRLPELKEQWAELEAKITAQKTMKELMPADQGAAASATLEKMVIDNTIWKALYALGSLIQHDYGEKAAREEYSNIEQLLQTSLPESEINLLSSRREVLARRLDISTAVKDNIKQSYLDTISLIRSFPARVREQEFSALSQQSGGNPLDPLGLTRQLAMVAKHVEILAAPAVSDPWEEILNSIRSDGGPAPADNGNQ